MAKKILIGTALSLEYAAVNAFLQDTNPVRHPDTNSIYCQGKYQGYEILLMETGAGNVRAADETGRAIAYFKPAFVFFVGVAGGIKDVKLGDVVASSKVIGFEVGKDDAEYKPRFDTVQSSYLLEQVAKHVGRENQWQALAKGTGEHSPLAFIKPIAAGEKVVSSTESTTFSYLKKYCSDAVAVDMEGNGFLIAARPYHSHAIEIRGISDLLDNKEESDQSGSQPLAASNAAAFCFEMINQLEVKTIKEEINSLDFRKKLSNTLTMLYPQGPEQDDIWKRAGGDVSILVNFSSRRSQWFNAIEKLHLGGGGRDISITSLINEVKGDYPNHVSDIFR